MEFFLPRPQKKKEKEKGKKKIYIINFNAVNTI